MNTIQLLEKTIQINKDRINGIHIVLPNIIDIQEKNEYINAIEELQNDNLDYIKSIEILNGIE